VRHPSEYFLRYLIIRDREVTDAQLFKALEDRGFLSPEASYFGFLRQEIPAPPDDFNAANKLHRPSMRFLRDQRVYEMFYPTSAVEEAKDYLTNVDQRVAVEQVILARLDYKVVANKLNRKNNWRMTEAGILAFRHFFWNLNLLTFDQWGRYLYERSAMYDRYVGLLQGDSRLAFFHLRLDQTIESKTMIKRAQDIAYFALEEVSNKPGVRADKVKAIGTLAKAMTDCHNALSTSDMALTGVLKEFERFRMSTPQITPPSIYQLAPKGNFSGSGMELIEGQIVDVVPEPAKTPE
jgi:hypothetical protein